MLISLRRLLCDPYPYGLQITYMFVLSATADPTPTIELGGVTLAWERFETHATISRADMLRGEENVGRQSSEKSILNGPLFAVSS